MKRDSLQRVHQESQANEANKIDLRNEIQEQYGKHPAPWFSWVFDALDLPAGSRILELGCGTGQLWQDNRARIPAGWKISLADTDQDMLYKARANLKGVRRAKTFIQVDGQAIPCAPESFKAVLAVGVLDLLPDLRQALGDIWRVLRPGGLFIATAGGRGHLKELEDLLRPFLPPETAQIIGGQEKRFGLENGEQLLAPFFEGITRRDYRDRMVFQQLQPVLDYVFSEQQVLWSLPLNRLGEFVQQIKREIAQKGAFRVTVRKGVFIARKPSGA